MKKPKLCVTYMLFTSREVRIGKNCVWGLEYGPRPQAEGRPRDRGHSFSQYGPTKAGKSSPLVKEKKRLLKAGVQFYNTVFKTQDIYFYMYVCMYVCMYVNSALIYSMMMM